MNDRGFSLLELLLVVAIIGIIAAVAVPNLVSSRDAANEASAIHSIRSIISAEYTYSLTEGDGDFAPLANMGAYLDELLVSGSKDYYSFLLTDSGRSFTLTATPTRNPALSRHFFADQSGVIRYNNGAAADVNSPPLGGGGPSS